ncbi:cyclopropane-fatty-acyl-phospholipid synthase family protein [Pseudonocardia sp. MH-G8]|uniref:SAM-dependent methyltransferase n=1 Tax=Pseudonocardia sp. MH-G8 TaxID=1854588 RepID=UPI001E46BF94|nr:class I SAM-dependent methyltransferase [Pseudonocardia sp. MH-G8]
MEVNYFSVVESGHEQQNPCSVDGLRRVAGYLDPQPGERVLDVGGGRGWWAVDLAVRHGVSVTVLEINPDFADAARRRAADAGVADRVEVVVGPAAEHHARDTDIVTCLGASFALDGSGPALAWMTQAMGAGGRIAIGEIHVAAGAPREVAGHEADDLAGLAAAFGAHGLELTGLVSSTVADWDHYESQHWASVADWTQAHPDHPDHPDRAELLRLSHHHRDVYLREMRAELGWSVLVGRRAHAA